MYQTQQKCNKNNRKQMENHQFSERIYKKSPNVAIFTMDIFFAQNRNYTFGIGENWIRCSGSLSNILIYQIEILIFLYLNHTYHQVTNHNNHIFKCLTTQIQKFILSSTHKTMSKENLSKQQMYEQCLKFLTLVGEINQIDNLTNKISALCTLVNANPICHKIINSYILNKIPQKQLKALNQSLGINLKVQKNGNTILLNQLFQAEYRVSEADGFSIKVQNCQRKQKSKPKISRLMRKSTTRSVGGMSEDEDDAFVEKAVHFKAEQFLDLLNEDCPEDTYNSYSKKPREAFYSTSVQDSQEQEKEDIRVKKLVIKKQYDLTIKPIIFKKIQSCLRLNSKIPKFLKEKNQLKRYGSRGNLQSPLAKFQLPLKNFKQNLG